MVDRQMRVFKERLFHPLARPFQGVPPWHFSLLGLLMGAATALALWRQAYALAFLFWFLNRLFDGLDGAVARHHERQSDFGGYLDILVDFVTYALVPIGLVLGRPSPAAYLALAFLLAIFYVNSASWLYLSAILEKRALRRPGRLTSVAMPAGLVGGTVTILFYSAFILFPGAFVTLFWIMGGLTLLTIVQRLAWAARRLEQA